MKNKIILNAVIAIIGINLPQTGSLFAQNKEKHNYIPKNGYVSNEKTAISIAVAVWNPIYGGRENRKRKTI
jgi:hypothetical protein